MIRFTDGPAMGQYLMLKRAPLYLRVVGSELATQREPTKASAQVAEQLGLDKSTPADIVADKLQDAGDDQGAAALRRPVGKWDALDQIDDTHGPADLVTVVYRRIGTAGVAMVDWTENRKRRGGCFASAEYAVVAEQPGDDVVRNQSRWEEWCYARQKVDFPKAGVT